MITLGTQAQVTKAIQTLGFLCSIVRPDNSSVQAFAVWDSKSKLDLAQGASKSTGAQQQLYIAGNVRRAPRVGDSIRQGTELYYIQEVEEYRPASLVLAYRCVCI